MVDRFRSAAGAVKPEDQAHVSGDWGILVFAVRKDTAAALAGTDADYIPLIVDANGRLHVLDQNSAAALTALQLIDNAISGAGFNITQLAGAAVPIGAGTESTAVRVTLPTDGTGKVGHNKTGIGHGVTTVTTAGTDVVLAASTVAKVVIIQAQTDNTSWIAVGASGVDATIATGTGALLSHGDSVTLEIDNLADVYIDSLVDGEGVRYTYLT